MKNPKLIFLSMVLGLCVQKFTKRLCAGENAGSGLKKTQDFLASDEGTSMDDIYQHMLWCMHTEVQQQDAISLLFMIHGVRALRLPRGW